MKKPVLKNLLKDTKFYLDQPVFFKGGGGKEREKFMINIQTLKFRTPIDLPNTKTKFR